MSIKTKFNQFTIGAAMLASAALPFAASAQDATKASYLNSPIAADYVTDCQSGKCAMFDAGDWSAQPENSKSVAVAVSMGVGKEMSDFQVKSLVQELFAKLDVKNLKFFFEENDIENTSITFHVRGSLEGPFILNERLVEGAKKVAGYVKDDNPVLAMH